MSDPRSPMTIIEKLWGEHRRLKERVDIIEPRESINAGVTEQRSAWLSAGGIRAPGLKPATFISHGIGGAWQFADAAVANQESVSALLKVPDDMIRTLPVEFCAGWSAAGISPGDCYWQIEYLWTSQDEDTAGAAQDTKTVAGTASVTPDGLVITTAPDFDLPSSTDICIHLRLTRLSANVLDTIADTVELSGIALTYYAYK